MKFHSLKSDNYFQGIALLSALCQWRQQAKQAGWEGRQAIKKPATLRLRAEPIPWEGGGDSFNISDDAAMRNMYKYGSAIFFDSNVKRQRSFCEVEIQADDCGKISSASETNASHRGPIFISGNKF